MPSPTSTRLGATSATEAANSAEPEAGEPQRDRERAAEHGPAGTEALTIGPDSGRPAMVPVETQSSRRPSWAGDRPSVSRSDGARAMPGGEDQTVHDERGGDGRPRAPDRGRDLDAGTTPPRRPPAVL